VTRQWVEEVAGFGMGHTFGDYDLDGRLDFYMIAMSSTTARRLDRMESGVRTDRMRARMGYGNRMYLGRGQGNFQKPAFDEQAARSSWSWGNTTLDVDLDGDNDLFVANGHMSGRSARDYCTQFWRHDIYIANPKADEVLEEFFVQNNKYLDQTISWNGFEKNRLYLNQSGKGFESVAFCLGLASELDSRAAVADDFDLDGRPDLLVTQWPAGRRGPQQLALMMNRLETGNHWIGVRVRAAAGRAAIGAKLRVTYPGGVHVAQLVTGDSFTSQHANMKLFGLGAHERVTRIEVTWLDGTRAALENPAIDRYHTLSPE